MLLFILQINAVVFSGPNDQYFATCSDDGILHLWSSDNLEHLQFQVMGQVGAYFAPVSNAPQQASFASHTKKEKVVQWINIIKTN